MGNKSNKTLLDFQDDWEKIVDKAFDDFSSLTKQERVWFTIQSLIDSVDNGGLVSYYYNSGADFVTEVIEDLDYLGCFATSNLIREFNQLFPNGKVPADIDARNDIITDWDEKYDDLLNEADKEFYSQEESVETKLIAHIKNMNL